MNKIIESDVIEAIKELNRNGRPAQLSTIFQEMNKVGKYSNLNGEYKELAAILVIMRSHNRVTWNSTAPNYLGASETVRLVEGSR